MTFNPIQSIDKTLVAKRFAHARNTYGREARVQQQVAEKMLRLLMEHTGKHSAAPNSTGNTLSCPESISPFRKVAEFGCGTGCYSRLLLHTLQPESLLLNDLCPEMEECIKDICDRDNKGRVKFMPCDAETLEFPQETDLITSCSTLQWFNDPEAFFLRCHHALAKDGILAFSTFGTENMHQIRRLTGHGLDYLPAKRLQQLLAPHFDVLHAEEEIVSLSFTTPQAVLKHLKQTGVTGTEKRIWTRGRLQRFCEEYIRQFTDADGNVTLTYHPIYIIAKNKKTV